MNSAGLGSRSRPATSAAQLPRGESRAQPQRAVARGQDKVAFAWKVAGQPRGTFKQNEHSPGPDERSTKPQHRHGPASPGSVSHTLPQHSGGRNRCDWARVGHESVGRLDEMVFPPSGGCLDMVGLTGLEPVTSALSGRRSNRLSYRPAVVSTEESPYWTARHRLKSASTRDANRVSPQPASAPGRRGCWPTGCTGTRRSCPGRSSAPR